MHFSKLFRVKEGKLKKIKQWFSTLNSERKEEAIATFAYENVTREIFILFQGNDGNDYVIGCNEANGPIQKSDPNVAINKEHNAIKQECLEPISNAGEVLLDLKA